MRLFGPFILAAFCRYARLFGFWWSASRRAKGFLVSFFAGTSCSGWISRRFISFLGIFIRILPVALDSLMTFIYSKNFIYSNIFTYLMISILIGRMMILGDRLNRFNYCFSILLLFYSYFLLELFNLIFRMICFDLRLHIRIL